MKSIIIGILILSLYTTTSYAQSNEYTKWFVRARGYYTMTNENSNYKGDNDSGRIDISDAFTPELDITYFFNKNIAVELMLSTSKHDIGVKYTDDFRHYSDLGYFSMFPPTISLQYHFYMGNFKPYLGAGVNYTMFYGEGKDMNFGLPNNLIINDTFGFSLQGGLDYILNDKWLINFDIKNLFVATDGVVKTGKCIDYAAKAIPCPDYEIIENDIDLDINTFMVGLGIGYRF